MGSGFRIRAYSKYLACGAWAAELRICCTFYLRMLARVQAAIDREGLVRNKRVPYEGAHCLRNLLQVAEPSDRYSFSKLLLRFLIFG